jgi:hypothetical protein
MFLNATSKLNLGFKIPAFFVAIFMASVLVASSSCSKDKKSGIAYDLEGEYSGFNGVSTTGNIDLKVTPISSDEVEVEYLTENHFLIGYQLLTRKYQFKLTYGSGSSISLNSPQQTIKLIYPVDNLALNFIASGSGTYVPNPNGNSEGSQLLITFSGEINGLDITTGSLYTKQ